MNNMEKLVKGMSIVKVDQERRIVSGFATLDNVDEMGDIVTKEASMKAFSNFRGNVREQHSKIAAGRILSYGIEKCMDTLTNKIYDGIFVRAYVSKGAESTWIKVLDGTLTGFSIGGEIIDFETQVDDEGNMVNVIKEYKLRELSLVDNPANQLANITSIEKSLDMVTEDFEKEMNTVAEVTESNESTVEESVAVEVAEPVVEPVEPVATESNEITASTEETVEPVVESVDTATVIVDEVKSLISANNSEIDAKFAALVSNITDLVNSITTSVKTVSDELVAVKGQVAEFTKLGERVEQVEKATAVRKSDDLGEVGQEKIEKSQESKWGGSFLAIRNL